MLKWNFVKKGQLTAIQREREEKQFDVWNIWNMIWNREGEKNIVISEKRVCVFRHRREKRKNSMTNTDYNKVICMNSIRKREEKKQEKVLIFLTVIFIKIERLLHFL